MVSTTEGIRQAAKEGELKTKLGELKKKLRWNVKVRKNWTDTHILNIEILMCLANLFPIVLYMFQRWSYPVDKSRRAEGFDDDNDEEEETNKKAE